MELLSVGFFICINALLFSVMVVYPCLKSQEEDDDEGYEADYEENNPARSPASDPLPELDEDKYF